VEADVIKILIDLNRKFYQTFAQEFSATRQRLQPGVLRILDQVSDLEQILDLGCGNGGLAEELSRRGHQGIYLGLDSNRELLNMARERIPDSLSFTFLQRDLTDPDWDRELPHRGFDLIIAFAVLHHLPGTGLRRQILEKVRELIAPEGRFIHSEWQFTKSPRLKDRIQPWEKAGLQASQVDPGDYLLDWRQGGEGLRYIHLFGNSELEILAQETGYKIVDSFSSDGEGGSLGLYQIWKSV
jgi:tRNA (uracil-5-)-methyltransferase TRM9